MAVSSLEEESLAIVHPATARFGGPFEVASGDLSQAIRATDQRIAQLGKAFGDYSGAWAKKDPGGFADFSNDWMALLARYGAAKASAQSIGTGLVTGLTGGLSSGGAVDRIYASIKQVPGKVSRGDFDDLVERLRAQGVKIDVVLPQPGPSALDKFYAATAPLDLLSMGTGEQQPKGPAGPEIDAWLKLFAWVKAHEKEIAFGVLAFGGLLIFGSLFAAAKAAPIVVRGATAGLL